MHFKSIMIYGVLGVALSTALSVVIIVKLDNILSAEVIFRWFKYHILPWRRKRKIKYNGMN